MLGIRLVPIMIMAIVVPQSSAMAQQPESVAPEPLFHGLTWRMTASTLRMTYVRSDKLIEGVPGVWQDLDVRAHSVRAFVTLRVGPQGLYVASVAFFFATGGQRFSREDVISQSSRIVDELSRLYGKPLQELPWNGTFFSYVWVTPNTLVQFAWDGADNWGIQYRSRTLDADAQELLRRLR